MTTLRWGILSTANIARKTVPGLIAADRCEVVAVGSRNAARAREFAAELGIPRVHDSYEALLADPDIDAIYNPLPNHLHMPWTLAALRAGKHVLCEKPLATSSADAETMARAADDAGVRLMEAFMYRLHPSWLAVRKLVASNRIGPLVAVQSWFSYYNDDPGNIRNIREFGGGALFDIGCYNINLSRMLFGGEPRRVEGSIVRDPESGVDVTTSGLLVFDNGTATFTCSTRAEPDQRVHIHGTNGRIAIEIPFNIPPDRPSRIFLTAGGDPPVNPETETITFPAADAYACEAAAFAAAVLDGGPLPTPIEDAVANLRVIERLVAAAEG
jgi:predicted dehydrogenase